MNTINQFLGPLQKTPSNFKVARLIQKFHPIKSSIGPQNKCQLLEESNWVRKQKCRATEQARVLDKGKRQTPNVDVHSSNTHHRRCCTFKLEKFWRWERNVFFYV